MQIDYNEIAKILITAGITLFAAFKAAAVTHRFNREREQENRRVDIAKRSLDEFYGPMLSMVAQVQLRKKVFIQLADSAVKHHKDIDVSRPIVFEPGWAPEERHVDYIRRKGGQRYRDTDLPLLREMVALFRQKYWLIADSTLRFQDDLIVLLEIWEISQERQLHTTVIKDALGFQGENRIFEDLQKELQAIKERLAREIAGASTIAVKVHTPEPTLPPAVISHEEVPKARHKNLPKDLV